MDERIAFLNELKTYNQSIDSEVTLILQSLQWDRNHLMKETPKAACKYDANHRVPHDKLALHENECFIKSQGYSGEDLLLPDPLDVNASTMVTLSKPEISQIIENAARTEPGFQRGRGSQGSEPLSLERLQVTYSSDERRAIHYAVVSAVPSCHDLNELALISGDLSAPRGERVKTRAEILSELRDMKRRRAKYRVAAKSRNYSDVLRDVIRTQMEHYSEVQNEETPKLTQQNKNTKETETYEKQNIRIKQEPDDDYRTDRAENEKHRHNRDKERSSDYTRYNVDRRHDRERSRHRDEKQRNRHDNSRHERDKKEYRHEKERPSTSSQDRHARERDRSSGSYDKKRKDYSSDAYKYDRKDAKYSRDYKQSKSNDGQRYYDDRKAKHDRDKYNDSYEKSHSDKSYKRYYDTFDDKDAYREKRIKVERDSSSK